MTPQKSISTVNVIELMGESNITIRSWNDNPEGNAEAEKIFRACLKENASVSDEDVEACIEDGHYEEGTYQLFLVHSS